MDSSSRTVLFVALFLYSADSHIRIVFPERYDVIEEGAPHIEFESDQPELCSCRTHLV